jgi:DNA-directed RNA polymerase specialized sigma24 family protein
MSNRNCFNFYFENIFREAVMGMGAYTTIKHESLRIALNRQENAARTEEDFEKLTVTWDRLDRNREQREQRYEKASTEDIKYYKIKDRHMIIPEPGIHIWWRELLRGDFLNFIHDCPYEIQEFTASRNIYELVGALKDTQKEVLYYRAIRGWSNQKIAAMRGQTDRNILKTYETLIESLRYKLFVRLIDRFIEEEPLTLAQREFVMGGILKYSQNPKCKRRTKEEIEKRD